MANHLISWRWSLCGKSFVLPFQHDCVRHLYRNSIVYDYWFDGTSCHAYEQSKRTIEVGYIDHTQALSVLLRVHRIMRVINMIPSYQLLSFLAVCFPNTYLYLQGFTEVFQGIALYAFLMLLCDFLAPTEQSKVEFFSSVETNRQWQPKKKRNGLVFLKVRNFDKLQYENTE